MLCSMEPSFFENEAGQAVSVESKHNVKTRNRVFFKFKSSANLGTLLHLILNISSCYV